MEAVEEAASVTEQVDFSAWVSARGPALQRFAYLVTGNAAEAPDLVQEALSRVYPRWERVARSGAAEAYVRRSIVNASVSGWRKQRRLLSVPDPEPFAEPRDDPTAKVADADRAWQLCAELPVRQRTAVVLRFYEDMSYAEIALVLDCPEPTARSHVHRALAALRDRLRDSEEPS